MNEKIECKRLILAPLSLEEMEQFQNGGQYFLLKSVLSNTVKTAVSYKIEQMKQVPEEAHPWLTYWLISEKSGGRGIGVIGCKHLPDADGYVELGYAIAAECRCRGYMTEALDGFLDWLYEQPFLHGAKLSILPDNTASIKTACKCGFYYETEEDIYRIYRYIF